jgi:hypothetical protein
MEPASANDEINFSVDFISHIILDFKIKIRY